jgi:hypothetical protein
LAASADAPTTNAVVRVRNNGSYFCGRDRGRKRTVASPQKSPIF